MKARFYTDKQKMKLIRLYFFIKDILEGGMLEKFRPVKPMSLFKPRFYTIEEKRRIKTDYMMNKQWFCQICNNGKNYKLAGKHAHLRTKKHFKNSFTYNTGYIHDEKENT